MIKKYNQSDITRIFGRSAGTSYQNILAAGLIKLTPVAGVIRGLVEYKGSSFNIEYSTEYVNGNVSFEKHSCTCADLYCQHVAGAAFHALATYPALVRKVELPPSGHFLGGSKGKKRRRIDPSVSPAEAKPEPIIRPDETKTNHKRQYRFPILQFFVNIYDRAMKILK
jgi:hypothetical protein